MTVAVDEDDMTDIELGGPVNISLTAYPDDIYQAEVTEISDAYYDSSSNVVYDVTVTITSDASGLFQGMTGDVTFVTKESEEVLYVSNRAITRSGTKSYVKMRDSNGNVTQVEVTTGFSDGVYVEIIDGLSEGDVVLIESVVSD
ncbi:MAG: efflux RND transporter periplasmic adaptor subunit [Lachnospiraceae bacterium]|nr:efflux RND transporter periplasmic adaptor subunit [Lachnospiraceae bacterium]